MVNPSNLYAEKIFSEHPIAMWSFDDNIKYLSLITDAQRSLTAWTFTSSATGTNYTSTPPYPKLGTTVTNVRKTSVTTSGTFTATSNYTVTSNADTFAVGFYYYKLTPYVTSVRIGYKISGTTTWSSSIATPELYEWGFVSTVFAATPTSASIVIEFTYAAPTTSDTVSILINGLTVGNLAEDSHTENLGSQLVGLPASLGTSASFYDGLTVSAYNKPNSTALITAVDDGYPSPLDEVVKYTANNSFAVGDIVSISGFSIAGFNGTFSILEATSTYFTVANATTGTPILYNPEAHLCSDVGYILADSYSTKVYGRNTSFPMTFGSENVLVLSPNEEDAPDPAPSLVLPGKGFLNESEKYKTKTFEAWIRVKAQTTTPRRIIGPISGADGLYVNGAYLMLSVGDSFGSFYVGEWDRPMLVQITTSNNSSKLFLNGELVITLLYDINDLTLADYYATAPATNDWIGFYCYSDVPRLEVDCVAIYAYEVDKVLALRRFVYAQGVDFPTGLVSQNGGQSVIPDYSAANYANNYTYGDQQRFSFSDADKVNNIDVSGKRISAPTLVLPQVRIAEGSGYTEQDLFSEQAVSDYLDLQPSSGWNSVESHLYFDKISQLSEKTRAIYIIATRSENNASKQILFKIFDKINGNFLEAYTITSGGNNNVIYRLSYNGTASTLGTVTGNVIGTKFAAGLDIDLLISSSSTHGSNLRSFFSNQERLALYVGGDEEFTADVTFTGKIYKLGFANERNFSKISGLFTSGRFSGSASTLDAHTASYTLVIKNFANNVYLDIATNMYWQESIPLSSLAKFISGDYLLDYLQLNLDYPRPITFSSGEYNTDNSEVRAYVTFQDATVAPKDVLDFGTSVRVTGTNTIENTTGYATTKYEMVDGTVIYVPSGIDKTSYFATVHLEVNINGIKTNPIQVRNIQVASQALSLVAASPTEIGTKAGLKLLGYAATAATKNPIVLPKDTDNHLYLSANSGITISGTNASTRGLYLPLNTGESDTFDVAIIQATMKFQLEQFSTSDVLLFEVEKEDGTAVKFYIDSLNTAQNRAKIFAKDQTGATYTALEYYVNGVKTEYPAVSLDEWVTIGIRITEHFDIAGQTAKLKISGPMLLNNISYFQLKAGDEASSIMTISRWIGVLYNGNASQTWNAHSSSTWGAKLTISASATEINGLEIDDVYKSFAGTSKIIAAYDATDKKLKTKSYGYIVYIGSSTDTVTSSPL